MSDINKYIRKIRRLLFLQGNVCFFCHKAIPLDETSIEHLVPTSKGGSNDDDNCVVVCRTTNEYLGNMTIKQKMSILLHHAGPVVCPRMDTVRRDHPNPRRYQEDTTDAPETASTPTTTSGYRPRVSYGSPRRYSRTSSSTTPTTTLEPAAEAPTPPAASGEQLAQTVESKPQVVSHDTESSTVQPVAPEKQEPQVESDTEQAAAPQQNEGETQDNTLVSTAKTEPQATPAPEEEQRIKERAATEQRYISDLVSKLAKQGDSRPRRSKALAMAVGNWFPQLQMQQIKVLIDRLVQRGFLRIDRDYVSYRLPAIETEPSSGSTLSETIGVSDTAPETTKVVEAETAAPQEVEPSTTESLPVQPSKPVRKPAAKTQRSTSVAETSSSPSKASQAATEPVKPAHRNSATKPAAAKAPTEPKPKPASLKPTRGKAPSAKAQAASEPAPTPAEPQSKTIKRTPEEQRLIQELINRLKARGRSRPRKLGTLLLTVMNWFPQITESQARSALEHLLYDNLIQVDQDNVGYQLG